MTPSGWKQKLKGGDGEDGWGKTGRGSELKSVKGGVGWEGEKGRVRSLNWVDAESGVRGEQAGGVWGSVSHGCMQRLRETQGGGWGSLLNRRTPQVFVKTLSPFLAGSTLLP